jgi:hypothetical protein
MVRRTGMTVNRRRVDPSSNPQSAHRRSRKQDGERASVTAQCPGPRWIASDFTLSGAPEHWLAAPIAAHFEVRIIGSNR